MTLVGFLTVDNETIFLNPEHVATVQASSKSTTEIALVSGRHIIVRGFYVSVRLELMSP